MVLWAAVPIWALVSAGAIGAWIVDSVAQWLGVSQQAAAQMDTNTAVQRLNQTNPQAAAALANAAEQYARNTPTTFGIGDIASLMPVFLILMLVGMVRK